MLALGYVAAAEVGHWISHAFHAAVSSPRLMYGDVTIGFGEGTVTLTGRPLRSWRLWSWGSGLARFLVLVAEGFLLAQTILAAEPSLRMTSELVIRLSAVVAAGAVAFWLTGAANRRAVRVARERSPERVVKLPLSDVTSVRLSGKTLTIRAPFDQDNRSNRWRLRLDSHGQGESLVTLLGGV